MMWIMAVTTAPAPPAPPVELDTPAPPRPPAPVAVIVTDPVPLGTVIVSVPALVQVTVAPRAGLVVLHPAAALASGGAIRVNGTTRIVVREAVNSRMCAVCGAGVAMAQPIDHLRHTLRG